MSILKNVSLICLLRTICANNGFTNHKKLIVDYPLLVLNLAVNIPDMVLPLKSCFSRSDLANFSNFVLHFVSTCWGASLALNQTSNRNTNFYPESYWVQLRLILGWKLSLWSCTFKIYRCICAKLHFYLYRCNITPIVLWPVDICIQGHSTLEEKTDCGKTTIALC